MSQCDPTRQSDEILPPIAPICVAVTTAVQVVDLTTVPQSAMVTTVRSTEHTSPFDQYITGQADGACFLAFGANAAALASLSTSSTTTISAAGAITAASSANNTIQLAAGEKFDWRVPAGSSVRTDGTLGAYGINSPARFLGVLTSTGTTTLRFWISSR